FSSWVTPCSRSSRPHSSKICSICWSDPRGSSSARSIGTSAATGIRVALDALVLLGCRVAPGALSPPAARRAARAAEAYREGLAPRIVVSGGQCWEGVREADALAEELVRRGVPEAAILLERA